MSSLGSLHTIKLQQVAFGLIGVCIGLILTFSFLSGDDEGRVNLLYLLLLFVFLPVLGILFSLVSLVLPDNRGIAGIMFEMPVWSQRWLRDVNAMSGSGVRRAWFFYLSQLLTLSLGLGCLIAFFLVLLLNDVSFVWRSTVLEAADLFPVLNFLALPWVFWNDAQPSLMLLERSQDFRLGGQTSNSETLGQWWKYAFAAQLTYNLLPRSLMLLISRSLYRARQASALDTTQDKDGPRQVQNHVTGQGKLAPVVDNLTTPFSVVNWAAPAPYPEEYLEKFVGSPLIVRDRMTVIARPEEVGQDDSKLVILVKSWEPPMGELKDFMTSMSTAGLVLPLDWDGAKVNEIRDLHLSEWRRFCGTVEGWSILSPESH